MSEASKFKCAACGREFRWRPEIAGKKAKCKCGASVQVPAAEPAAAAVPAAPAEEHSFDDVYALAAAEAEHAAAASQANQAPLNYAAPPSAPPPAARTVYTPSGAPIPKRAKWDNTPSTFERWGQIWRGLGYAFLGLLFCAYGYYEFWALGRPGRHRMRIWIWFLYMIGGRWAVLVIIGGMGVLMVLSGILAMFGKMDLESDE
jgi:DNA-directed RNA polymerase subunit RPC12/RpoP